MIYYARGSVHDAISDAELRDALGEAFGRIGRRRKVLALPPDFTRFHSMGGRVTELAWEHYGDALTDVMPATGTHVAMTDGELRTMFGRVPSTLFRVHDWRQNLDELGRVPADFVRQVSEGRLSYDWPAQVDRLVTRGGHDLILSIGQVVPHEVVGMAGFNKNVFVGAGGPEAINKSHYLGAVYGMERMMGRADTPVRRVFNYASHHFTTQLPIVYVLTVVGSGDDGRLVLRGLFVGDDEEIFARAAELSLAVNFTLTERPISRVVVYLDPDEFKSTWLGNKAIYRTRMAIADGGELVILAPGVCRFGEDREIDALIRAYGYCGTPEILRLTAEHEDLRQNLSAAAHLIHGSSEGRFSVTYCAGGLTRQEIEKAGFRWGALDEMMRRYDPAALHDGWNELSRGENVYYISNPAIGLWASRERFGGTARDGRDAASNENKEQSHE